MANKQVNWQLIASSNLSYFELVQILSLKSIFIFFEKSNLTLDS
jgi:hypothetical protein